MKGITNKITIILAVLAALVTSSPALAWDGEQANVVVSEIQVDGYPWVGDTVTVSGTVCVTAGAMSLGMFPSAEAYSLAGYMIADPDGNLVYYDTNAIVDSDSGFFYAAADASQVYNWEVDLMLNRGGDYEVAQGGYAAAEWEQGFWIFYTSGSAEDFDMACQTITAIPRPSYGVRTFTVLFPSGYQEKFRYCGHSTDETVFVTDGEWVLKIPKGMALYYDGWKKPARLRITEDGQIVYSIAGMEPIEFKLTSYSRAGDQVELIHLSQ